MNNKKHIIMWILSTAAILFLLFSSASYADLPQILSTKKLVVAVPNIDNRPFFSKDKYGDFKGIDITIAKNIAHILGVKLVINKDAKTFDQIPGIVTSHKADISICNLSKTLERAVKISFTKPYMPLHFALMVNRIWFAQQKRRDRNANIVKLLEHGKGTIGVIKGTAYATRVRRLFPHGKIKSFEKYQTEAFDSVLNNNIAAAFDDDFHAKYFLLLHRNASLKVKIVMLRDHLDLISIGLNFDSPILRQWLDIYLTLYNVKYLSEDIITHLET